VVGALLPGDNVTRHPHISRPVEESKVEEGGVFVSLSAENLLVTLPTPDFSMPYNVICLVCTVVALAFGPLHNICTKRLLLEPIKTDEKTGYLGRVRAAIGRLTSRFRRGDKSATATPSADQSAPSMSQPPPTKTTKVN